jgi:hypothetical protein
MVEDKQIGNLYKTTTNRGGGGAAKGEKPEVSSDITKIGKVVGKLGSGMALISKKKLAAVANPDGQNNRV